LFRADAILSGRRKRFGRRSKIGARQNVHESNTRGERGLERRQEGAYVRLPKKE
jgi:hypothetical protein